MKKIKFIDLVIVAIFIGAVLFTVKVIQMFEVQGQEPATLVTAFFGACVSELAICWRIYAGKKKIVPDDDDDLEEEVIEDDDPVVYYDLDGGSGGKCASDTGSEEVSG